ncbi:PIN domain-containing protein [Candidatus Woesearchaeota archaeon]|nr:PIN domain-containing protein [Candidatus Woesearchaeota archaeon]
MKEIFDNLKRTNNNDLVLLDTCFIIDVFHHHKEKELLNKKHEFAITSFNAEELEHVIKKVKDKSIKERIRKFFKDNKAIKVLDVPVHPGNTKQEKTYVQTIDPYLAQDVPDPSDAVLIAAAIKTRSKVVTKDKHHLFTAVLEKYLKRWGITILKDLKGLDERPQST